MEHQQHFIPTIHIHSGPNAKIYVNTIINSPGWSTGVVAHPSLKPNAGDQNSGYEWKSYTFNPHRGGRLDIYCGSEKEVQRNSLPPMITVGIQKLSPGETSEIKPAKAYVITVHTNNVSGEGAPAAPVSGEGAPAAPVSAETELRRMIEAENVVLNSLGDISVGPGAGASNEGPFSGSSNSFPLKK